MYFPNVLLATVVLLFLIHVASPEDKTEKLLKYQLNEIVNIKMVNDTSNILNWNSILQRIAIPYMRDCDEMFQHGHTESGLYVIRPEKSRKLVVWCHMDGCNGWTVIQRNSYDTEITWSETWTTYKYGLGKLEKDHWLGNEHINFITEQKWYKVKIELVDAKGSHKYAEYDSFILRNESDGYRVSLGSYEGNAGDPLTDPLNKNMHDNLRFSCKDQDHDRSTLENCADVHGGGWWYDSCYNALLNRKGGLYWSTLCDGDCKESVIMLKPIHMYCSRV
ncbi:fibrinogen-like protein 1-like protein [Hemicordylus capensis]|uniref:fibrinogen-like protein 1-like protein n=1 Tax=Hemicordylus capensis TaxID=884348 RepID=UPI002302BB59|nr:fibrinogen-like protein 1-like protein [Hemicordylus capensis]